MPNFSLGLSLQQNWGGVHCPHGPFHFSCLRLLFGQQREILNLKWASGQCGRWLRPRFQAVLRQTLVNYTHTGAAAAYN